VVVEEDRADVPRLAIINSGAMRFDIFKGPFTRGLIKNLTQLSLSVHS